MMKKTLLLLLVVLLTPKAVTAQEIYAVLSSDETTLTFYYDTKKDSHSGTVYENEYADNNFPLWYASHETVTTVVFDESMKAARPESTSYWFYEFENLKNIKNLNYLDTREVTDMGYMFFACRSLTSLDVSNFDTKNVTTMEAMFLACNRLISLDVSNFDTKNVTTMETMFLACNRLTSLDVSNFDTSKVTSMKSMFASCYNLTSLDLSSFDTGKVANMSVMFYGCDRLTSLDVSNFDTKNVTTMEQMFLACSNLTSLDLSNFDTRKVTDMRGMFSSCSSLTSLDLSSFDTGKVTDMSYMFNSCSSLAIIYCAKDWSKSPALKYSKSMFFDCPMLEGGIGTVYDENHVDVAYARPDGGPEAPGYFTKPENNGDVNGDGNVDVADISTIIDIMAGKLFSGKGDVNVDGNIDVADISTVIDIMAGKIVFPQAPAGVKGIDLGLPSGTLWANMNVGAEAQNEYGLYFAWGETKGYSSPDEGRRFDWASYKWMAEGKSLWLNITKYTYADCNIDADWYNTDFEFIGDGMTVLCLDDDAARANWGGQWRIPTAEHIQELLNNTDAERYTLKGVNGYKFTSKINGNTIFLPAAGCILGNKLMNVGTYGEYSSSSLDTSYGSYAANIILFYDDSCEKTNLDRYIATSIRPIIKGAKPFAE